MEIHRSLKEQIIWLTTLSLTAFLFIPIYFFSGIRRKETKMNTLVTTILMIAIVGIQFTLTSVRRAPSAPGAYLHSEQLLQQMENVQPAAAHRSAISNEMAPLFTDFLIS